MGSQIPEPSPGWPRLNQDHHKLPRGYKYSMPVRVSETCPRHARYAEYLHEQAEGKTAVTEQAAGGEFDQITSVAELGSLLRRLRDDKTQQNIADHAKRHHLYVHRPDLSAIERGRRLPTANELRGILYGCGHPDVFDRLDCVRQQLMAEPTDLAASNYQHQPVTHLSAVAPGIPDEEAVRLRSQESDRGVAASWPSRYSPLFSLSLSWS